MTQPEDAQPAPEREIEDGPVGVADLERTDLDPGDQVEPDDPDEEATA